MKINKQLTNLNLEEEIDCYNCKASFLETDNILILFGVFATYTKIKFLDLLTNMVIFEHLIIAIEDGSILNDEFAITPNGKYIAYNDNNLGKWTLFDSKTQKFYDLFQDINRKDIRSVSSSNKGNYFIFSANTFGDNNKEYYIIYDILSKSILKKIKSPTEKFNLRAEYFIEEINQVIFICELSNLHFYNFNSDKILKILEFPYSSNRYILSITVDSNYKYIVCLTDSMSEKYPNIIIWDIQSEKIIRTIYEQEFEDLSKRVNLGMGNIYFSPNSKYLILQTLEQVILYDFETGNKLKKIEPAFCSTISLDGKYLGYSDGKNYKILEIQS